MGKGKSYNITQSAGGEGSGKADMGKAFTLALAAAAAAAQLTCQVGEGTQNN